MTKFAIEGRDSYGNWSDDNVCAVGRSEDVNRFESRAQAELEIPGLAKIFECSEDDLRVVEVAQ